jgi:hypothetical protein
MELKYAFISEDTGRPILENLSKEHVLSFKKVIPEYFEKIKTTHPLQFDLKIDGIDYPINGNFFFELHSCCKIVPMWTLAEFE